MKRGPMLTGKEEAYFARAESKRLQAVNDELLAALRDISTRGIYGEGEHPMTASELREIARAAIKKAETK